MEDQGILIDEIEIKNFRSIRSAKIKVGSYNIFVGLNDVGKSNLLKSLNLFFNGETDYHKRFNFEEDFSYLFPKKSHGTHEIKIKISFILPPSYRNVRKVCWEKSWRTNGYFEEKIIDVNKGKDITYGSNSRVPGTLRKIKFRYVPAVKSRDYYQGILSDLYESISSNEAIKGDNGSLNDSIRNFSNTIKEYTEEISNNAFEKLGLKSELQAPKNLSDIFRSLKFITTYDDNSIEDRSMSIDLEKRGDGIQARHIPFILKYIADEDQKSRVKWGSRITTIWAYEEPENGLELKKQFEMAKDFFDYSSKIQMFISSHSPAFYLYSEDNRNKVFYVSRGNDEATHYETGQTDEYIKENMGLMPLVAPYIKEANEKLNEEKDRINVSTP